MADVTATMSTPAPTVVGARPPDRATARAGRRRRGYLLFAAFAFPNLLLIAVFAYLPVIGNASSA